MNDRKLLRTGLIGSAVAAVCCFTPVLVLLVAGVGLSAVVGYLDYGLFPALFAFMGLTAWALYLRSGRAGPNPKALIWVGVIGFSALLIWLQFRYALRISVLAALLVLAYAWYLDRKAPRADAGAAE